MWSHGGLGLQHVNLGCTLKPIAMRNCKSTRWGSGCPLCRGINYWVTREDSLFLANITSYPHSCLKHSCQHELLSLVVTSLLHVKKVYLFIYFLILKSLILTCVPKHEPPSHLPLHNIFLGHPCAPAPSMLYPASNIDWQFDSYMIVCMFQCHSPKSSHPLPLPLPLSPKVRYTHLCLFCCLAYRVIIAIFLNSIYMC